MEKNCEANNVSLDEYMIIGNDIQKERTEKPIPKFKLIKVFK